LQKHFRLKRRMKNFCMAKFVETSRVIFSSIIDSFHNRLDFSIILIKVSRVYRIAMKKRERKQERERKRERGEEREASEITTYSKS